MSVEEDTELRDIVMESLEQRGVVGKTKAMLRAHVFTALEETVAPEDKIYKLNKRMRDSLSTNEGRQMAALIVDYFDHFELEFCKTVFEPETGYTDKPVKGETANSLGIVSSGSCPLLADLLSSKGGATVPSSSSADLTSKQISDARLKFTKYDKDENGVIDKDELRNLFTDIFPSFHHNMLDRYVNDEFKAADKDFSSGIEFDEFLALYRRLFILCRSVVSHQVTELVSPRKLPSPRQSRIPIKSLSSPRNSDSEPLSKSESQKKMKTSENHKGGAGDVSDIKDMDQRIADLGFDVPDDDSTQQSEDYDDDFEKSGASSARSRSKTSKSDNSFEESIKTESLTEDIADRHDDDDDIDALLKDNDISWGVETTDKTVEDDDSLKGVDFWEFSSKQ